MNGTGDVFENGIMHAARGKCHSFVHIEQNAVIM